MSVSAPVIDYIDPVNRRIYLLSGVSEWHPVDDIYTEVRALRRLDESLRPYDAFCEALPLISKGGGKFTGRALKLLLGTKIIPFDEDNTQTITGELLSDSGEEGLALIDTVGLTSIVKIFYSPPPAAEYILTFSDQINAQSFIDAAVYLDVNDGAPGTEFPRGTPTDPVDNLTDALAIVHARALHRLYLRGFVSAGASQSLAGIEVKGGSGSANVLLLAGASTDTASFEKLIVAGEQRGLARFRDCILGTTGLGGMTGVEGRIVDCIINHPSGVVQNPTGAGALFDNCSFVAPNDPQIVVDVSGLGFGMRLCTGNILIINHTSTEMSGVNILGARAEVDASCTGGSVIFSGMGSVADNSAAGCSVDVDMLADAIQGSDVWQRLGLDPSNPMTTTQTSITTGGISIDLTGDGVSTSVSTRQP